MKTATMIPVCFGCDHPVDQETGTHHSAPEDVRTKKSANVNKLQTSRFGCPVKGFYGRYSKTAFEKDGDGRIVIDFPPDYDPDRDPPSRGTQRRKEIIERCPCEVIQPIIRQRAETGEDRTVIRLYALEVSS